MENLSIEQQRAINYVEYYEKVDTIKRYSLSELLSMSELELLQLMPQNQCVYEYSDIFGCSITKYSATFKMSKVIDGSWHIGYYEGNRDKTEKEQHILFEETYVKDLRVGLIDLFWKVQNSLIKYFNGVKSGEIKIILDDCWDDRKGLGLDI